MKPPRLRFPRLDKSHKTIAIMAGIAVVALAAGLGLGTVLESPGEAAAKAAAPAAGPITAQVDMRTIANVVTIRGDVQYDNATSVNVLTSDLTGPAIVTAAPPKVGTQLQNGSVAAQITGRPVIVLEGSLPTYRTLRIGSKGPDVAQLKAALKSLGIDPGNGPADMFDQACAKAVGQLYEKVGYPVPDVTQEEKDAVTQAQSAVNDATSQLQQAKDALAAAQNPSADSSAVSADQRAVADAQANLTAAQNKPLCSAGQSPAANSCYGTTVDKTQAISLASNALTEAQQNLNAAQHPAAKDTSALQDQVTAAQQSLDSANQALTQASDATLPYLPSSEVVYLPSLPRRVDQVSVSYGQQVSGPIMKVSGTKLTVSATASADQAALLKVGDKATITMPDGSADITATVASLSPAAASGTGDSSGATGDNSGGSGGSGASGGSSDSTGSSGSDSGSDASSGSGSTTASDSQTVALTLPTTLSTAQINALNGQNVRVQIPVKSTGGKVLAVPVAALDAGPSGETRVTKLNSDGTTTLITVKQGLSADGFAQITPTNGSLKAGDLVVVGTK